MVETLGTLRHYLSRDNHGYCPCSGPNNRTDNRGVAISAISVCLDLRY